MAIPSVASFHVTKPIRYVFPTPSSKCFAFSSGRTSEIDYGTMRVAVLREELKKRGVDYSDCFDKESLIEKLRRHEENSVIGDKVVDEKLKERNENVEQEGTDDKSTLTDQVQTMSVKALREELASRNQRWADYIDKESLVQAVVQARMAAASFSATGLVSPGQVSDLTAEQIEREIAEQLPTPLVLDVYATWCGPCQLMAKELKSAAQEWGDTVRVVKMDSDKYPELSGKLKVQGLPTLLLFQNGSEVQRMEGALPKTQLLSWVQSNIA